MFNLFMFDSITVSITVYKMNRTKVVLMSVWAMVATEHNTSAFLCILLSEVGRIEKKKTQKQQHKIMWKRECKSGATKHKKQPKENEKERKREKLAGSSALDRFSFTF